MAVAGPAAAPVAPPPPDWRRARSRHLSRWVGRAIVCEHDTPVEADHRTRLDDLHAVGGQQPIRQRHLDRLIGYDMALLHIDRRFAQLRAVALARRHDDLV